MKKITIGFYYFSWIVIKKYRKTEGWQAANRKRESGLWERRWRERDGGERRFCGRGILTTIADKERKGNRTDPFSLNLVFIRFLYSFFTFNFKKIWNIIKSRFFFIDRQDVKAIINSHTQSGCTEFEPRSWHSAYKFRHTSMSFVFTNIILAIFFIESDWRIWCQLHHVCFSIHRDNPKPNRILIF